MTAAEMKAKCEAIIRDNVIVESNLTGKHLRPRRGGDIAGLAYADAIAAIPIEPDPRDAQIAALREALQPFAGAASIFEQWRVGIEMTQAEDHEALKRVGGGGESALTVLRRYTFKLYPTATQEAALTEQARMSASLWNALLEMRETFYRRAVQRGDRKTSLTAFDQGKDITALRAECPEWAAQPRGTQERVAEMLDLAFKAFFRRAKAGAGRASGYPKFKRVHGRDGEIVADSVHFREPVKSCWSFAPSKSANGGCPAVLSASDLSAHKGESRRKVNAIGEDHCGTPSNGGETQAGCVGAPPRGDCGTPSNWRLRMRGVPGMIRARGKFPVPPTAHKTADIRFHDGAWWFSICVAVPSRRSCGDKDLKVAFDLIDEFASVKGVNGECLPGLSDPFSKGRDGESPTFVMGSAGAPAGAPRMGGDGRHADGTPPKVRPAGAPRMGDDGRKIGGVIAGAGPAGAPQMGGDGRLLSGSLWQTAPAGVPQTEDDGSGSGLYWTQRELAGVQSARDRRFKRFSCRWRREKRRVARIEASDARRRREALHLWTTRIVRAARSLAVVAAPIAELSRSGRGDAAFHGAEVQTIADLNGYVRAQAPSLAVQMLEYKAAEAGISCTVERSGDHQIRVGRDLRAAAIANRRAKRAVNLKEKEVIDV